MKGIEISKRFFEQHGRPVIRKDFPQIEEKLAFGLCGSGSECFGYDDEISRDHDFEPGFCIFLPENLDSRTEFALQRAYEKLPDEFMGLKRNKLSPVGGNRHGVIRTARFFTDKTGTPDGRLSAGEWLSVPEYALAEAVNGEIFEDNLGEVTAIRARLAAMPEDVRLKKLASHLLNMAQAGQYNYSRCMERGESAAAQLAAGEFVSSALQTAFLLNRTYMPYYKWRFRALSQLPELSQLYDPLEFLIASDNMKKTAELKSDLIENISAQLSDALRRQDLTAEKGSELERLAYAVNNRIQDHEIRNLNIFAGL